MLDDALEACAEGRSAKAFALFDALNELVPPDSIRLLIQSAKSTGCSVPLPLSSQTFQIGGYWAVGQSSNVNAAPRDQVVQFPEFSPIDSLTLTPEERPRGDGFVAAGLQVLSPVLSSKGLRLLAVGQLRRYAQETSYHSSQFLLGLEQPLPRLGASLQAQASHWHFGDDGQESQARLGLEGRFTQSQGFILGYGIGLASTFTRASSRSRAHKGDLTLWGQWAPKDFQLTVAIGFGEDQLGSGQRVGGDRIGQHAVVQLQALLGSEVRASLSSGWAVLRDTKAYNEAFFGNQRRESNRHQLVLAIESRNPLFRMAHINVYGYLSAQAEDIKDRIPLFSSEGRSISLGFNAPLR